MEYKGRYNVFDPGQIVTYPVSERTNKVSLKDLIEPDLIPKMTFTVPKDVEDQIDLLAQEIVSARKKKRPVLIFSGAHLIKNGLGKLLADLAKRDIFTMISGKWKVVLRTPGFTSSVKWAFTSTLPLGDSRHTISPSAI